MNEQDEDLDPRLKGSLDALRAVSPRDPQAAARGRGMYLARADALSLEMAQAARRSVARSLFPARQLFAAGAAILLVLFLLLGGTGVTVYAAHDSLPNAPLYPVKLLSEDAQLALTSQPENKLGLYLAFADRRVNEMVALDNQRVAPPDAVADRLAQELDGALELAAGSPEQGQSRALERMQATIRRQQQLLGQVAGHVADPAKPVLARVQASLADHLSLVELGLTDPPGLQRHMHGAGNSSTPPGLEKRAPATPPGQDQRPGGPAAPGKDQRPPVPPGQEQRSGTPPPGQERRATAMPTAVGPSPTPTATPRTPGGGKGK